MDQVETQQEEVDSQTWWARVKQDPARMRDWLLDQYRGEATAADRIETLRDRYANVGVRARIILTVIAAQERQHAKWIGSLLEAREIPVMIETKSERYWAQTLPGIEDFETGCAVGAHAERMRLERIEVIASDPDAPADVRSIFQRILPEEQFHARAFAELAGEPALAKTQEAHALGREALGLQP